MAIDINIPSQVKTYANLAAFPATGSLKTIFIAEDTNKTYRWTGSAYVEISASQATAWGTITGTLSSQTDLNTALSGKVPTSRTLTINGTTQDLSADRTFTISTGITIGTTAITSGTVGRVLFQGTGNVVQQSSSLFWDATNNRLDIVGTLNSTSSLNGDLDNLIIRNTLNGASSQTRLRFYNELTPSSTTGGAIFYTSNAYSGFPANSFGFWNYNTNGVIAFATSVERMRIASTGNVLINTTTDAGFKLDVNGTARATGSMQINSTSSYGVSIIKSSTAGVAQQIYNNFGTTYLGSDNSAGGYLFTGGLPYASFFGSGANYPTQFASNNAVRMTIFGGGNIAIGTTTDVASSLLTMQSTTKGFLPPRMTTTQKNAIATPATGLMVYDTTLNLISVYNGTIWISL